MKSEVEEAIKSLVAASKNSKDSHDAMRYSQAAVNLANAFATFQHGASLK